MDMQQLMAQAQQMQANMQKAQAELAEKTVEATAGGGAVKVTANGAGDITGVTFDEEILKTADKEMLEDLVLSTVREAQRMASDMAQTAMSGLLPPGMGGLG